VLRDVLNGLLDAVAGMEVNQALKDAIRAQVEFYFSPANLTQDNFLLSKMNAQMFVPLHVVAQVRGDFLLIDEHGYNTVQGGNLQMG